MENSRKDRQDILRYGRTHAVRHVWVIGSESKVKTSFNSCGREKEI